MRADLSEISGDSSLLCVGVDLAVEIIRAIDVGSSHMSPFLHFSKTFEKARHWLTRGRHERHEKGNVLGRVSRAALQALSQERRRGEAKIMDGFVAGDILDMSSQPAAAQVLGSTASEDRVQDAGF